MVSSKEFASLSADKFSFYSIDIHSVDDLIAHEKEQVQGLMKENDVVETPTLLFLNPESLETNFLYCGSEDLEASLIVSKIAVELKR